MRLITKDELKKKIDNQDDFKLVMALSDWHYNAKHIPGSIQVDSPEKGLKLLNPNDEIIVYCSDKNCVASQMAYITFTENGCKNVRRYAGGIADWEEAGFPLEGEMVE